MDKTFGLNEAEIAQAVALLARLEPGYLPYPLFLQFYRLTPAPTMELIPFRRGIDGALEVLLVRRLPDDPLWPNMWHNPGVTIRANDTHKIAMERIFRDDLQGLQATKGPVFAQNLFVYCERGTDVMQVYWVEVTGEAVTGTFWPMQQLPADIITSESDVIQQAAAHYLKEQ
jgi:hypothetical protein